MFVWTVGSSVILLAAQTCCFGHGEQVKGKQKRVVPWRPVMSRLELWRYASGRWVLKICDGDDMVTGHQK